MSDIIGKKFHKLIVIAGADGREDKHGRIQPYLLCKCECGNLKEIKQANVLSGNSKTCGIKGCTAKSKRYGNEQKEKINRYLTKENLIKYIPIYSANFIAKKLFYPEFVTNAGTVIDRAKSFGIKTNNYSDSRLLANTEQQIKNTCVKRYGVESISLIPIVKTKKIQSAIRKYGTINVFQAEEIKDKCKATCLERYGVEKISYLGLNRSCGKLSKYHSKIQDILDKYEIKYKSEAHGKFIAYNEYLKNDYSPIVDILIEESKLVIECNGDYWHANPKIYKETDTFDTWEGKKTARDIWEKDSARQKQIESFGYTVLVIWESDYNENYSKVEKEILNAVKNNKNNKTKKKRKNNKI